MLKRTFTFTDYNGVQRTEEHCFHLTQADLAMMNLSKYGGIEKHLRSIIDAQDIPTIAEELRQIIRKSYGKISPDGRRFIKSEEISDEFEQTEAYSQLFMEMITDENAAAAFASGIIPKDLADAVAAKMAEKDSGSSVSVLG